MEQQNSWKDIAVTVGTKLIEGILAGASMACGAYLFGLALPKPEASVTSFQVL